MNPKKLRHIGVTIAVCLLLPMFSTVTASPSMQLNDSQPVAVQEVAAMIKALPDPDALKAWMMIEATVPQEAVYFTEQDWIDWNAEQKTENLEETKAAFCRAADAYAKLSEAEQEQFDPESESFSQEFDGLLEKLFRLDSLFNPAAVYLTTPEVTQTEGSYCYNQLTDAQKYAYGRLQAAFSISSDNATINFDQGQGVKVQDLQIATALFQNDHPELFWYSKYNLLYYDSTQMVVSITPICEVNGEIVSTQESKETLTAELENAANAITNSIPATKVSNYDKALYLHDYLADHVIYESNSNDQSAYGALVKGKAVCAGYARAYQYLLQRAGINALTITGTSSNPSNNTAENHAWNMVWMGDDICVYSDVTWDDQGSNLFHAYFNRTKQDFDKDHSINPIIEERLPACDGHTGWDYFSRAQQGSGAGIAQTSTTAEDAAAMLKEISRENYIGSLCFSDSGFETWIESKINGIIAALNFSGNTTTQVYSLGDEHKLKIWNPSIPDEPIENSSTIIFWNFTNDAIVRLYPDNTEDADIKLDVIRSTSEISGAVSAGMSTVVGPTSGQYRQTYSLSGIDSGTYKLAVYKPGGYVTFITAVNVEDGNVAQNVQLCLRGDANNDGCINVADIVRIRNHITGITPLVGYSNACADANKDGNINVADIVRIRNHITGISPLQ